MPKVFFVPCRFASARSPVDGRCYRLSNRHFSPELHIKHPEGNGVRSGTWRGGSVGEGDFGVAEDFTEAAAAVNVAVDMGVAAEGDIGGVVHLAGFAAAEDIAGVGVAGGSADAAVTGEGEGDLAHNGAEGAKVLSGVEDMVGIVDVNGVAVLPGIGGGLAFDAGAVGTEFSIVVRLHSKAYRIHLDGGQGGGEACAIDIAVHDAGGQGGGNRAGDLAEAAAAIEIARDGAGGQGGGDVVSGGEREFDKVD